MRVHRCCGWFYGHARLAFLFVNMVVCPWFPSSLLWFWCPSPADGWPASGHHGLLCSLVLLCVALSIELLWVSLVSTLIWRAAAFLDNITSTSWMPRVGTAWGVRGSLAAPGSLPCHPLPSEVCRRHWGCMVMESQSPRSAGGLMAAFQQCHASCPSAPAEGSKVHADSQPPPFRPPE